MTEPSRTPPVLTGSPVAGTIQPGPPAEPENLADAIKKISAAVQRLARSGLNKKAIVVLVSDSSGIGKRTVEQVISSLDDLARLYTTRGAGK